VFGDGGQYRDFVYVADVVRYLQAAMRDMPDEARVFNICTGRTTTVVELARAIAELAGVEAEIAYGPARAGDIRESVGDPAALQAAFGFAAETRLKDGLRETLKDYL
jgi:UDP-glucose 4-epimerase